MHTHTHNDVCTETISRKQACASLRLVCAWFKNCNTNLHCTVMVTLLLSLPILLLAEHVYTPVSSLEAFVIVKFTLTLVTFPYPVGTLTLSLTDTLSLKISLILFHTTVGGG